MGVRERRGDICIPIQYIISLDNGLYSVLWKQAEVTPLLKVKVLLCQKRLQIDLITVSFQISCRMRDNRQNVIKSRKNN